jgi:hypothetical protein
MMPSEKPLDSGMNLRWLAWERKNRREDRRAERHMKLVFAVVGVILVMLIAYALTQVSLRPSFVEKGPIVASQWTTAPRFLQCPYRYI